MKLRKGPARAALLSTIVTAALTTVAASPAAAAATPPYEPDSGAAGSISFYDTSGNLLTSGSTSTQIGYAVGSASLTATGSKASLYGYLPSSGKAPGAFSGELLAGPTTFPVSGAPGGSTNPTVKPAAGDLTFADLAKDFPNTATDAYAGLYQIRIKTTDAKYLATDISISNGTWSQVYPGVAVSTSTALTVDATSSGQNLTATLTPSSAAGTVQFQDGGAALGSPVAVSGGTAVLATALSAGSHSLSAVFTPTDSSAFTSSTSSTVVYVVKTATSTALTVANAGSGQTLTATTSPSGTPGSVQFFDGANALGSPVTVSGDTATLSTTLSSGTHSLTATFTPDDQSTYANSTSAAVSYSVGNVTINGSVNQFVKFQQRVIIAGKAPAGSTVTVYFHRVNVAGYTYKTFPADANGNWGTKYDATDDYTYFAVVGSKRSATVNSRMDPSLSTRSQTVRKGTQLVLTGRGGNKTRVTVHLGSATATVVTAAGGSWRYVFTVARTTRIYVNRPDHVITAPAITVTAA